MQKGILIPYKKRDVYGQFNIHTNWPLFFIEFYNIQ